MSVKSTVWIVTELCAGCCSDPIVQVCSSREVADALCRRLNEGKPQDRFYADEFKVDDDVPQG